MNKFFPRLSVKDICTLGLLLAITVLLAVFGTFRIGDIIKIPTKFVSVFVAAAIFGPVWGGLCAALGDLLNATIAPVGPLLPQITLIEFLCGFVYGVFFMNSADLEKRKFALLTVLCVLVQFFVDMAVTTWVLTYSVGIFPNLGAAFVTRLPAGIIKAAMQLFVILPCRGLLKRVGKCR